ncbi:MAG: mandelate racemase/muconate lactonizing enzyme family protein [Firmicutes bacterium]|jgi:L-alanine-DL-glutamate epimerase-like enolase superfamily enzyme|nr:mandelate racemase/muconate lactonizing enzyme family protein [Bacillota bacterium]MCL5064314.1 mandelate racemase/muconate lactonizing enzyme family protein [Bacillota bacterium]
MKIVTIETFTKNPVSIVRVTLDDGQEGIGQIAPYQANISALVLHQQIAPLALGQEFEDIPEWIDALIEHEHKFPGSYVCRAVAGLDTALWDAKAKASDKSVTELVGGRPRSIAVYGSSMRRDISPDDEAVRLRALADDAGYRAFKIRVATPFGHDRDQWPGRTEAVIPAVRQALGDDIWLYADANSGYTPGRAIEVGRLLEDHGYCHYEEPCPYPELEWTQQVADALEIAVAGGEQDTSMATWHRMIRMRAVDIVQPDICYVGGFSRALKVARLAADAGLPCTPHAANRSLLSIFTMHLLAAIENGGPYMEHSIEPTAWTEPLFDSSVLAVHEGEVQFPTEPGWGVSIAQDWLDTAEHQVTPLQ